MKLALTTAAFLALQTPAAPQEPWSIPELLRSFHLAAYPSPDICPASDEIALFTFNATGLHPSRRATTMANLTIRIIGFRDGEVIAHPDDANRELTTVYPARRETIECVKSAAREQGATRFVVQLVDIDIRVPI